MRGMYSKKLTSTKNLVTTLQLVETLSIINGSTDDLNYKEINSVGMPTQIRKMEEKSETSGMSLDQSAPGHQCGSLRYNRTRVTLIPRIVRTAEISRALFEVSKAIIGDVRIKVYFSCSANYCWSPFQVIL